MHEVVELVYEYEYIHCSENPICLAEVVPESNHLLHDSARNRPLLVGQESVHQRPSLSASAAATGSGTRSEISALKIDISFTPVEERKLKLERAKT